MDDRTTVQAIPVTPDATETAVRAAMRIALRNGCAITRDAAEQIATAVLGCAAADAITQYGCRYDEEFVQRVHDEAMARKIARAGESLGHVAVSRKMTIGPWEEIRDGGHQM